MFEHEVNHAVYRKSQLPSDIRQAFEKSASSYEATSVLQWEEHCTECAMPDCYATCDLYEPRKDGKCRRFTEGIASITGFKISPVKVSFKKWGSLMATGRLDMVNTNSAVRIERKAHSAAVIANTIPDQRLSILGRKGISSRLATRYKKSMLKNFLEKEKLDVEPDHFLLEVFNPETSDIDITFTIRSTDLEEGATPYQNRFVLGYGFHDIKIDYKLIKSFLKADMDYFVSLTPNIKQDEDNTVTAYFGTLGFIKDKINPEKNKTVKIIAWDLDNTVWKGTLVEDGPEKLELTPNIKSIMETLDQRGIVNSVVSKNNQDEAMNCLKNFGLDHLIVFPQISWEPKSQAIKSLIEDFNVGEDTIAFIDDSAFEREEVKSSNPAVRVFDARQYIDLLDMPEFNPEQSTESSRRREFYINQGNRNRVQKSFSGDYLDFVASCEIQLSIATANADNIERIQELVQRTNQMNFSGNRYNRDRIVEICNDPELDTFCLTCIDKFGDYGTVGFCVIDRSIPQLIDLMFSCRIQSKRIEHAFLSWLLHKALDEGFNKFSAIYNKTPRNAPAGRVFGDLGFIELESINDRIVYEFDLSNNIPWDALININIEGKKWLP